ncbi:MAG: hypothetical protein JSR59_17010 [Proteobacteria bacterium]|nr:hypothetical protein [Pseudomonadota bacterium]
MAAGFLTACGGGGSDSSAPPSDGSPPPTGTYSIGGTVSGLTGTLTLQDNGGDALSVSQNGTFAFAGKLDSGSAYDVTVATQPAGQTCTVTSGSGSVSQADVSAVSVACTGSSSAPSSDLMALAIWFTGMRTALAVTDMVNAAQPGSVCAQGTVAIDTSSRTATYASCSTPWAPENTYSGQVVSPTSLFFFTNLTASGVTLASSLPTPLSIVLGTGTFSVSTGGTDTQLTQTFDANSLDFTAGKNSSYHLSAFTLGSPTGFTRSSSPGTTTDSLPSYAGFVTYNGTQISMVPVSTITWVEGAYPTAGEFDISAQGVMLNVVFHADGTLTLSDPANKLSATKHWTDADVQAALTSATQ